MIGNTGHKAAQRMFMVDKCETCGGTTILQRHHIDRDPTNNVPQNVQILCQECHKNTHMADGTWGWGTVAMATCRICGMEFRPTRTRRSVLCGNPQCHQELGRRSAVLRWSARIE